MSLVTKPFTFSAGAVIVAAQHNSCFDIIYSDYNGNITTANIASNANIGYTKLNLSNSILSSDINSSTTIDVGVLPTGTTANKLVKLDGSAKLPAVDGSNLTNLTLTFGTVITGQTNNTVYQAANDGFIYVYGTGISDTVDLLSDASNPPTTIVGKIGTGSAATIVGTITRPIKATKYYKVTLNGSSTLQSLEFWPL